MWLPSTKVIRRVDRDTTSLWLFLRFVLSKEVEFPSFMVDGDATGVCVDNVAIGIPPSTPRDDVDCSGERCSENVDSQTQQHGVNGVSTRLHRLGILRGPSGHPVESIIYPKHAGQNDEAPCLRPSWLAVTVSRETVIFKFERAVSEIRRQA